MYYVPVRIGKPDPERHRIFCFRLENLGSGQVSFRGVSFDEIPLLRMYLITTYKKAAFSGHRNGSIHTLDRATDSGVDWKTDANRANTVVAQQLRKPIAFTRTVE